MCQKVIYFHLKLLSWVTLSGHCSAKRGQPQINTGEHTLCQTLLQLKTFIIREHSRTSKRSNEYWHAQNLLHVRFLIKIDFLKILVVTHFLPKNRALSPAHILPNHREAQEHMPSSDWIKTGKRFLSWCDTWNQSHFELLWFFWSRMIPMCL